MIICPNCSQPNEANATVCRICRQSLKRQTRKSVWYWVGVVLLALSTLLWLLIGIALIVDPDDIGITIMGGVIITIVPISIGIVSIKRGRRAEAIGVEAGTESAKPKSRVKATLGTLTAVLFSIMFAVICQSVGLNEADQHNEIGNEFYEQGALEEAIGAYDEAIRLDPQAAVVYSNRGQVYTILDQYQRAIQDLHEAIRLDPQLAEAYNNRGFAYDSLGQFQRAIDDYNEAIRLNPGYPDAYNNLGVAYRNLGQFQRAMADYNQAIRLDPQLWQAYLGRGDLNRDQGKKVEAKADFEKVITLTDNPESIQFARQMIDELSQ